MSPIKPHIIGTQGTEADMGVVMASLNLTLTLKKLGVNPTLLTNLSEKGIELERTADFIRFKKPDGKTEFTFYVPSSVVTAASKGNVAINHVDTLRTELNDFIQDVVLPDLYGVTKEFSSTLTTAVLAESDDPLDELLKIGKTEKVAVKKPDLVPPFHAPDVVTPKPHINLDSVWVKNYAAMADSEPVSTDTIKNALPIPLKAATKIYTPVSGTGAGSRYFLVARYENFSVAVRLKGPSLSVRIEGDLSKVPQSTMTDLGFSHGAMKGYWSNHVKVTNTDEAQRFLGAVLAGLGTPLTPLPDLKKISMYGV